MTTWLATHGVLTVDIHTDDIESQRNSWRRQYKPLHQEHTHVDLFYACFFFAARWFGTHRVTFSLLPNPPRKTYLPLSFPSAKPTVPLQNLPLRSAAAGWCPSAKVVLWWGRRRAGGTSEIGLCIFSIWVFFTSFSRSGFCITVRWIQFVVDFFTWFLSIQIPWSFK
jgi:hypothetical protein